MPTHGPRFDFTPNQISVVPEKDGVYVLFDGDEVIYIGRAVGQFLTLRRCLSDHCVGLFGECTQRATHFAFELAAYPITREAELLDEFRVQFNRLPRCHGGRRNGAR
jgi:hypothetical protein